MPVRLKRGAAVIQLVNCTVHRRNLVFVRSAVNNFGVSSILPAVIFI